MLLQAVGQRDFDMPLVRLMNLMHLIQLLLYSLGLAAAEVTLHALHLHDLATARYFKAPLCALVSLHLGHETILFFLIIRVITVVLIDICVKIFVEIFVKICVEICVEIFVKILWEIRIVKLVRVLGIVANRGGSWHT